MFKSNIQINSKIQTFASPKQHKILPLQIPNDEKNVKKKFMDDEDKSLLEIVLWNNDKTKKLVNFKCSPGPGQFQKFPEFQPFQSPLTPEISDISSMSKELGNVKINFLQNPNGELFYKFDFETFQSSKVESQTVLGEQEFRWNGGKDNLDFKMKLNQNIKKNSWDQRFRRKCVGKENLFKSPSHSTMKNIITPSPKSCLIFSVFNFVKKNLNFSFLKYLF